MEKCNKTIKKSIFVIFFRSKYMSKNTILKCSQFLKAFVFINKFKLIFIVPFQKNLHRSFYPLKKQQLRYCIFQHKTATAFYFFNIRFSTFLVYCIIFYRVIIFRAIDGNTRCEIRSNFFESTV